MHQRFSGFTLIELALVLALAGLVLSASLPGFRRLQAEWQVQRAARSLLVALHHTRSAAATRFEPVALCQTDAAQRCIGTTRTAAAGWRVFVDRVPSATPRLDAGDDLLAEASLPASLQLTGTRTAVLYRRGARAGTTATLLVCDVQRRAPPRAVIVSQTGRPRASSVASDGSPLVCP